jgi:hypothetical protein
MARKTRDPRLNDVLAYMERKIAIADQDYPPRLDASDSPRCLAHASIEQVLNVQRDRRGLEGLLQ